MCILKLYLRNVVLKKEKFCHYEFPTFLHILPIEVFFLGFKGVNNRQSLVLGSLAVNNAMCQVISSSVD